MQAPLRRFQGLATAASRCCSKPTTDRINTAVSTVATGTRLHCVNGPLRPLGGMQWLSTATDGSQSFIHVVQQEGMSALIGRQFPSKGGFDSCLVGALKVCEVDEGSASDGTPPRAVASLVVTDSMANAYGTLHGGAVATLVDVLGTMALLAYDRNKPGVSIEINVTYTAAAEVGTKLRAEGTALKIGRRLGFTEIRLTDERTGRLIAVGRHTKAFP